MRRKDREIKDIQFIKELVSNCKVCHLGMIDNHRPYVIPINFGYQFDEDQLTLYFHSAKTGRKVDILEHSPQVCIEMVDEQKLTGEGDIACVYGYYFSSLIGSGVVSEVSVSEEKHFALELLMEHMTGHKNYHYESLDSVKVFKIVVEEYSVKARQMNK